MFGEITRPENEKLTDLNLREKAVLIPLIVAIFWIGIYPTQFFTRIEPTVKSLIEDARTKYEKNKLLDQSLKADYPQMEKTVLID
jgi:NADH-quinone oxidoreductase subunit M